MNVKKTDLEYIKLKAVKGAEVNNSIIRKVEEILESEEPEVSVTAERKDDHILLHLTGPVKEVQFSFGKNGKTHSVQWMRHNFEEGKKPPAIEGDTYRVGNPGNINKLVKVTVGSGHWDEDKNGYVLDEEKQDTDTLPAIDDGPDDGDGDDDKDPEVEEKLIPLATSEKEGSEFMRTDFYGGSIMGFFEFKGLYYLYFQNRAIKKDGEHSIEYMVSEDLEDWSKPKKSSLPHNMRMVTVDGDIKGWKPESGGAYIWENFDPVNGFSKKSHRVIDKWKIDGTLGPNYINGKYMQLGRVRGWRSHSEGGWDNDYCDYPLAEWYPDMVEAYQKDAPNFEIRKALHDRRGVSLHIGEGKNMWSNEIIVDPENVELPGFLGWEYPDKKGIADFYSATFVDEKRILLKVYWKENDRLIDRANRDGASVITKPQRRFRFTGETTVVPAKLRDGKIEFVSFDSVFPYDHFARKAHPRVKWATKPNRVEVGQYSQASNVIKKNGKVYLPFQYRDDVHYESANDWDNDEVIHLTGIYMSVFPEDEFYSKFE